ncbi:MAG: XRE family transcriptional regulator [Elusimicrobia bacterium]|nr:XRE family transcriptional regulator [Elusimicrobiota bacterium]
MRTKAKGLLARKMEDAAYRKRHEESYELFKVEVQLLDALERRGWTYSDLAKVMGTQKSAISRDLKGRGLQKASMDRVARMAEALGMRFVPVCIPEDKAERALPLIRRLAAV